MQGRLQAGSNPQRGARHQLRPPHLTPPLTAPLDAPAQHPGPFAAAAAPSRGVAVLLAGSAPPRAAFASPASPPLAPCTLAARCEHGQDVAPSSGARGLAGQFFSRGASPHWAAASSLLPAAEAFICYIPRPAVSTPGMWRSAWGRSAGATAAASASPAGSGVVALGRTVCHILAREFTHAC